MKPRVARVELTGRRVAGRNKRRVGAGKVGTFDCFSPFFILDYSVRVDVCDMTEGVHVKGAVWREESDLLGPRQQDVEVIFGVVGVVKCQFSETFTLTTD
jgi:hypothetical protein